MNKLVNYFSTSFCLSPSINRRWTFSFFNSAVFLAAFFCWNVALASNTAVCPDLTERNLTVELVYCEDMSTICLDILPADLSGLEVTDNGQPYTGTQMPCDFDTTFSFDYSMLPAGGGYSLNNWEVNGVAYSGDFEDVSALRDSMNNWNPSGNWIVNATNATIEGGLPFTDYSDMAIIQTASGERTTLHLNTYLIPNGTEIQLDTGMHQVILTDLTLACSDTIDIMVNCLGCVQGTSNIVYLEITDCEGDEEANLCTDIPMGDISSYQLMDNGQAYTGNVEGCMIDTTDFIYSLEDVYASVGHSPFDLERWVVDGTEYSAIQLADFSEMLDSMNSWDATANWTLNNAEFRGGHKSRTYGYMQFSVGPNAPEIIVPEAQTMASQAAIPLSAGHHELVLSNLSSGCSDTVEVVVDCIENCPPFIMNYPTRLFASACATGAEWCVDIPMSDFLGYQIWIGGQVYTEGLQACQEEVNGIYYNVNLPANNGRDPYTLDNWNINSNTYTTNFWTIEELLDSMNNWDSAAGWTYDMANAQFTNINLNNTYSGLTFSMAGNGIGFWGLEESTTATGTSINLPVGWNQVIVEQSLTACRDTVYVLVDCDSKESLHRSIPVGDTDTLCLSLDDLPGNDIIHFENVCGNASGEYAIINLEQDNHCLIYEALDIGMDSACIVICDDLAVCDTTYVYITVTEDETTEAPVAVADVQITTEGVALVINVLDNDQTGSGIDTVYLVGTDPSNSNVALSQDGTLSFSPHEEYCNSSVAEVVSYAICNAAGCDTTTVSFTVTCNDLHVFSGFSPNNDGTNDEFIIEGLDAHPNNSLTIFNRWGNQVFFARGYSRDTAWDGKLDGADLPDGTYFYMLEGDDGLINSGYVQLNR